MGKHHAPKRAPKPDKTATWFDRTDTPKFNQMFDGVAWGIVILCVSALAGMAYGWPAPFLVAMSAVCSYLLGWDSKRNARPAPEEELAQAYARGWDDCVEQAKDVRHQAGVCDEPRCQLTHVQELGYRWHSGSERVA